MTSLLSAFTPRALARCLVAAKRARVAYLSNLLVGAAIALLVYFVDQTGLFEYLLNRVLYLLLSAIGMLLNYKEYHLLTPAGFALDVLTVALATGLWTLLRTPSARILANLLFLVALVPLTIALLERYGVFINGTPIVAGVIVAIILDATADLVKKALRRRIRQGRREAEYSIIRHLAHNVKPGLQIARSPLVSIRRFLGERGLLGAELSRRLDGTVETVGEALDNALTSLGQINDIIDGTRLLVTREIPREEFREVDLRELLEQEVLPLHAGSFRTVIEGGAAWVRLHRESVVELFNNLLRNAGVHGFPRYDPDSLVTFRLRQTRTLVVIDYTNNGRPFPANLSAADFLTFGRKSTDSRGEGLGGAWIGKVIEAHGGDFQIIRDSHPVHFRIRLPRRGY